MAADLQDRVAELEEYARRVIPARDGTDGWVNFIETRLLQERKFSHSRPSQFGQPSNRLLNGRLTRAIETSVPGSGRPQGLCEDLSVQSRSSRDAAFWQAY